MKSTPLRLTLACLTAFAAPPLLAADASLSDIPFDDLLQTEIRSAGKRWERVRNIPASVTIITREDIERYGYVTFEELLKNVPGLFMLDNTGQRFLGSRGTVGGGVQFLVNGVPQHQSLHKGLTMAEMPRYNIPVESIDQVEVIRGPMSIIYGNNAFLGVINVVTNQIDRNGSQGSASIGNNGTGRLFARAGTASNEGFVVLNAGGYQTDGLDGAYADMMGAEQLAGLDPAMHKSMAGDMEQRDRSLDLSAGWRELNVDIRYTEKNYGIYLITPAFEEGNQADLATWHAALTWEHPITQKLGLKLSGVSSDEELSVPEFDLLTPELDGFQREGYRRDDLELDLIYDPLPTLNLLAGYRFRAVSDAKNRALVSGIQDFLKLVDDYRTHDLFTEAGWNPTDKLRLVGGFRLSRLPESYDFTQYDFIRETRTETMVPIDDRSVVTGRLSALWSPDPHQVVKLIWGAAAQDNYWISHPEPEEIETVELNYLRTQPGWSLSAGLFQNHTSNILRNIKYLDPATGAYANYADNSGEWLTRGLELEGELHPLPNLNLGFSAIWQHSEDLKMDIEPGYSPALLLKLKADYRDGPFTYALYAHYVGEMEADWDFKSGNTVEIQRIGDPSPAYWNLGLNLRYAPSAKGFYANLNASNLLDEEIRYPAADLTDFTRGLIGPGRVVTATVGWKF